MTEAVPQTQSQPDRPPMRDVERRPLPRAKEKTFLQRRAEDVPIILLAAILTWFLWSSVRKEVMVNEVIPGISVRVHAKKGSDDEFSVSGMSTIDLPIEANRGIFEKIKRDLDENNGITLVIASVPPHSRKLSRERGDEYEFDWARYVVGEIPLPETGRITRLEKFNVPIDDPAVPDLPELDITVTVVDVTPDETEVRGLATLFGTGDPSFQPDPITREELEPYLENLATTFDRTLEFPLTFKGWLKQKVDGTTGNPSETGQRSLDRVGKQPTNVTVRLRLRRTGEREIANTLNISQSLADLDKYTFEVNDINHVGASAGALELRAVIVGTKKELDRLEDDENRALWFYEIEVPPEERAKLTRLGPEQLSVKVKARLSLALRGRLAGELRDVALRPTEAQEKDFVLIVRLRNAGG